MRALIRAGNTAVPSLIEILERCLGEEETTHGDPVFGYVEDDLYYDSAVTIADLYLNEEWLLSVEDLGRGPDFETPWFEDGFHLYRPDIRMGYQAIFALGRIGPDAAAAVPVLIKLLAHPDYDIAEDSARTLLAVGPIACEALIDALTDQHVGWAAATVLGRGGPEALAALLQELRQGDRVSRDRALFAIGLHGERLDAETAGLVAEYLDHSNARLRSMAAWVLSETGPAAVPPLMARLQAGNRTARQYAVAAAGLMGSAAVDVIPLLMDSVLEEDRFTGPWSAEAMARIAPASPRAAECLEVIVEGLQSDLIELRLACIESMGWFEGVEPSQVAALTRLLSGATFLDRFLAVRTLGRLGARAAPAVDDMRRLLDVEATVNSWDVRILRRTGLLISGGVGAGEAGAMVLDRMLRQELLRSLGAMGDVPSLIEYLGHEDLGEAAMAGLVLAGQAALPALLDRLRDPELQFDVAEALASIGATARDPLLRRLRTTQGEDWRAVSYALGLMDRETISPLLSMLQEDDSGVQGRAAYTLEDFDLTELDDGSVEVITNGLRTTNSFVRYHLTICLSRMDEASARAPLIQMLQDPLASIRGAAVDGLAGFGIENAVTRQALIGALTDQDPDVRAAAASALADPSEPADALAALRAALDDSDLTVRAAVVSALGSYAGAAEKLVPLLASGLDSEAAEIRAATTYALGEFGDSAIGYAESIVVLLRDPEEQVRRAAAWSIGLVRTDLYEASIVLEEILDEPEPERDEFRTAIGLGGGFSEQLDSLIDELRGDDRNARIRALRALGDLGVAATAALPAVLEAVADPDKDIQIAALRALHSIPSWPGQTIAALDKALEDPDERVRLGEVTALENARERRAQSLPVLQKALQDDEDSVRIRAMQTLATYETDARPLTGAVLEVLRSENLSLRNSALRTLQATSPEDPALAMRIADHLDAPETRVAAIDALGWMGVAAISELAAILGHMRDESPTVRASVANAIAQMAPDDPKVLLALIGALQDESETVVEAAKHRWRHILRPE